MSTRFIQKAYGADVNTAITNDATGRLKVQDLPSSAGFVYDLVDNTFKFNAAGTIKGLADLTSTQTLTNKTFTAPTFTSPVLGAATATTLSVSGAISDTGLTNQIVLGTTPNLLTISSPAPSGAVTLTLPTTADTLVGRATTDTLTNKTVTGLLYTELAEVVTATNVIAAAESGSTFYLSAVGGFTSTLPAPALGMSFKFVVKTAPTGASYIITTNASANIVYGMFEERAGGAGVAGAGQDTQNFVLNQAIIGDWAEYRSDGTNWYVHGMVNVAAGITFAVT